MKGFIRGVAYFTVLIGGVVLSAKAANKVHGLLSDKEDDDTSSDVKPSDDKSEE